jgi:two-component system, sensor histidine kinase and response regulator
MIDKSLKQANILIIDDISSNIQILEGFLQLKGYQHVLSIADSRQVVHKLVDFQPDIILLDLNMPYYSGYEIIDQLKMILSANDYIPILVLTADSSEEAKLRALQAGASDFLSKPFNLLEVDLRIRNLLYSAFLYQQTKEHEKELNRQVAEKTESLIQKMQELTREKEKVEASLKFRTTFINNISHQIKTPLNSILGFSEILLDDQLVAEERHEYVDLLKVSGRKLSKIVNNFVEVSSIVSQNYEVIQTPFKLHEVVNRLRAILDYDLYFNQVELQVSIGEELRDKEIISDYRLLEKILLQLLENAISFGSGRAVQFNAKLSSSRLMFEVIDQGKGIDTKTLESLFNPYINLSHEHINQEKGTGLGLIIAKGYTDILQGNIWVSSDEGQGTTVFLSIPLKFKMNQEESKGANFESDEKSKTFHVLVVEDEEINFMYMNIILKQDGIKVSHAKSGLEALKMCQNQDDFQCVLMDINLPGMDGYETTRQIRQIRRNLPIIAISAEYGDQYIIRAKDAGCSDVLSKPVKAEELKKLVRSFRK